MLIFFNKVIISSFIYFLCR